MKKIKFNPNYILRPDPTPKEVFLFKSLFEMTFPELGLEEDCDSETYFISPGLSWQDLGRVTNWIEIYIRAFGKVRYTWPLGLKNKKYEEFSN